jgi:4-diphosphocytidyl-2-C-methyl-D-erythritol kinase
MRNEPPCLRLAYAKLNLSLRILAREASGFHQIETIFCALELADEIEISQTAHGISLDVIHPPDPAQPPPDLGPPEQNLAFRAAELFVRETKLEHGLHVRLTKRIPAGAGLGGGSSDAAAVLTELNHMHDAPLGARDLLALGARLGSDVPFFLTGAPLALAWGRGDRIAPLTPLPPAPVVLAVPPERVATAEAYAALAAARPDVPRTPGLIHAQPRAWRDMAAAAHNDFEEIVFARHPRLRALRQQLEDSGAAIARMTGTGSVVFGVFEGIGAANAAAAGIPAAYGDVTALVTQTRTVG